VFTLEGVAHAAAASGHGEEAEAKTVGRDPLQASFEEVERAEHEAHAAVLDKKRPYLNMGFFIARMVVYVLVWAGLSALFFKLSTDQDRTKSLENTAKAQRIAPLAAALFALSLTFAAVDWVMGLDPMWYSTIFGVNIFAGSAVAIFAVLILVGRALSKGGYVGKAINTEHFHDLGKLQFGFNVFWAYIAFSQFFLIWYSNIPEETSFYFKRWYAMDGSWKAWSLSLFLLHFVVPFALLLSRNIKRRVDLLALGAGILLTMHFAELYWFVLPNAGPLSPSWIDLACFLGIGGVYLGFVFRTLAQHPLIPVGDPRLPRALHFENA
jgi:hypothetical protein